jgi:hypothetical protein
MVLPFLAPLGNVSAIAGSERGEEPSGENPPLDSDPFNERRVLKKFDLLVKQNRRKGEPLLRVP